MPENASHDHYIMNQGRNSRDRFQKSPFLVVQIKTQPKSFQTEPKLCILGARKLWSCVDTRHKRSKSAPVSQRQHTNNPLPLSFGRVKYLASVMW